MVSKKEILAANAALGKKSLTTVFVGATSGIGLSGIEALLQNTKSSTVYIIGRSQSKFAPNLAQLQTLDDSAKLIFIEAQVSSLKETDRVCKTIISQQQSIDILWLSQGGLSSEAHGLNAEGLFRNFAIGYYSRILFMHRLLPLLRRSTDGRILSILATGEEGPIESSDPGLLESKNYKFWPAQRQAVSMMSLTMRELSLQNPNVAFIHTMPGFVSTPVHDKWADTMTGAWAILGFLMRWVLIPITHSLAITPQTAGRTGFYEVTNERYSSRNGKNFYRLLEDGEEAGSKGQAILSKYENDGTQQKIWEHALGVFKNALG